MTLQRRRGRGGQIDMSYGRWDTTGAALDGNMYVVGGDGSIGASTTAEVYDPRSNTWTLIAAPLYEHMTAPSSASYGGLLYVVTGAGHP